MSQLPERYQAAIAPLIDKAREFLEKGEALAPMAFVVNGGRFPHKSGVHRRHGTA